MLLVDSYFQLYSILFVEKFSIKPYLELLKQFVDQEKSLNGILHIPKGGMKVRGKWNLMITEEKKCYEMGAEGKEKSRIEWIKRKWKKGMEWNEREMKGEGRRRQMEELKWIEDKQKPLQYDRKE